jgi:hypothetical protein
MTLPIRQILFEFDFGPNESAKDETQHVHRKSDHVNFEIELGRRFLREAETY